MKILDLLEIEETLLETTENPNTEQVEGEAEELEENDEGEEIELEDENANS